MYVNIRCMRILENNFELYIGAGITSESKAESEWEETEYKKQVLLSVINKLSNAKKHGQ